MFMCVPITSLADCKSWYIKRDGTNPPTPPADIEIIKENGGFYLNDHLRDGEKRLYLTFDAGYENGNIERILDEVIFIDKGKIVLTGSADEVRKKEKTSIDETFRRMFKC